MPAPRPDGQAVAPAQGSKRGGNKTQPATSQESDWIAQMMLVSQQAANQASQVTLADVAAKPQFDPAAFLQSQQNLDAAYTAAPAKTEQAARTDWLGQQIYGENAPPGVRPTLPANASEESGVVNAQAAYDEQLRIRRADALNVNPAQGKPNIKKMTDSLSWDEYDKLSNLQKAAVDYNTMLVKAVKRDNKMQDVYDPTTEQQAQYDATVQRMFGDEGSDMGKYAPETVSLLNQIKYTDDKAGNLDDFLNLNAAIKDKDLQKLDNVDISGIRRGGLGSQIGNPVGQERMDFLGGLASQTQDAQSAALVKGNQILAKYRDQAFTLARAETVSQLGGISSMESGIGFGETKMDTDFQNAFDLISDADLAAKGISLDNVFNTIKTQWSEQDRQKFVAYAEKRLVAAEQGGTNVTDTAGLTPLSAAEVAQRLQLQGFKNLKGVAAAPAAPPAAAPPAAAPPAAAPPATGGGY